MRKISRGDIKDIAEYERVRGDFRMKVRELKSQRRVSVGPWVTLVFENRETVLFQIEEMIRIERMVQEDKIEFEIETYNVLVPEMNELRATLFIEITEATEIKLILDQLMGIDHGHKVWLEFGGQRVIAVFEEGHSNEEKISAVHFVTFPFSTEQARRFRTREDAVELVLDHPNCRARTTLSGKTHLSLIADLES